MHPTSAVPSKGLYRGVIGGLILAALLGVWFLVGSPRLPGEPAHAATDGPIVAVTPKSSPTSRTSRGSRATAPSAASVVPTPALAVGVQTPDPGPHDYTIKQGDTIDAVAAYYGVRPETIRQLNPTINPSNLQIGQVIHIPPTR